jgi:hypothetical protein
MTDPENAPAGLRTVGEIEGALDQVLSLIATAERLSRNNQIVNLSKLDVRVAEICAAIAQRPAHEAHRFAARLGALVSGLDNLEVSTRDAYRTLAAARGEEDLAQPAPPQVSEATRASAAYARALAVVPKPTAEPDESGERRRVDRRRGERRRGGDRRRTDRRDGPDDLNR